MAASSLSSPAFGQADLSNCEREQIHLAGSIQPHGALLVVSEPEQIIVQASVNAPAFLEGGKSLLGTHLSELGDDLATCLGPHLAAPLDVVPATFHCTIGRAQTPFEVQVHRPPRQGLVIELQPAGPMIDTAARSRQALQAVASATSIRDLADEAARLFKAVTDFDRVMIYRFDDDGHGEVFSEQHRPGLEPFLGNHYPASDIPQIARKLYARTRTRVLVDVQYDPVPIIPNRSPIDGEAFDMSLCLLRSMSPIHLQYLKNMGVVATLVISLMVGGRLWGLVACHHYTPRRVSFSVRAFCDILAEAVATRITALESFLQSQAQISARRLEQRMIEAISREGDWRAALFDRSRSLLQPVGATGAALFFEGEVLTTGDVPSTEELRGIDHWLDRQPRRAVFATTSLAVHDPAFAAIAPVASGLLAVSISPSPGERLVWFRAEQVQTVTWAGNPFTPIEIGKDPSTLSPRRSFSQWYQLVRGKSQSWNAAELAAARLIGETVTDIVLQFRAVRLLIAEDQLAAVRREVRISDTPTVVADPTGAILLSNEAFGRLLGGAQAKLARLEDLAPLFTHAGEFRDRLDELFAKRRPWRGEVSLLKPSGTSLPLLVRADAVLSPDGGNLGFLLLFSDQTTHKEAERARLRFQEDIVERQALRTQRLDSASDLLYRKLLASIVENAQLAALEITDGMDITDIPALLEGLRISVARTAETLEQLIRQVRAGKR